MIPRPEFPARRALLSLVGAGAATAALAACGGGSGLGQVPPRLFREGLDGRTILRFRPAATGLLAATDDGLYQRAGQAWQPRGLPGLRVLDLVVLPDSAAADGQRWLASVRTAMDAGATGQLVESRNTGQTWSAVSGDFGGPTEAETVQALAYDAARGRLWATGAAVLASSDLAGRAWQRAAGAWHAASQPQSAIVLNPSGADVWYGGQNAIEELSLQRWRPSSGSLESHRNLMPAPSVVKGLRFSRTHPERLLLCGEGGLVQTMDQGVSWQRVVEDSHNFYFDVVQDLLDPKHWVTARWIKSDMPQELRVLSSEDDGVTWSAHRFNEAGFFGGAWALAAGLDGVRPIFHIGLYRGGAARLEFN